MSGNRTNRAITNIAVSFMNQVLTLLLTFLSRTVFIHVLGVEYLGINGVFSDVLGLLSMADLGFNTAMVYSLYKPLAEQDQRKIAALIQFYKKIYMVIAVSIMVIGTALIPFLQYIVNLDDEIPHLTLYYILSLIGIVSSYACFYKTSILTADQKNYIVTRINMILSVCRTCVQIVVLLFSGSYVLYLLTATFFNVLGNVVASKRASREYQYIVRKEVLNRDEKRELTVNVGSAFFYKISAMLLNATDNILISIIVGTVAVGYYSNYLMITNKLSAIYTIIFTSLIASIGNLVVQASAKKRYEVFQCEQTVSFCLSCVLIPCFANTVNDFIAIWLGEVFVLDRRVVLAVSVNLYLACIYQPLWSYREAVGLYRKTKWVMMGCAVMNIVLSIALGIAWGIFGILIASSLARLSTYIWIEPRILFRDYFNENAATYYYKVFKNAFCVAAIVFITERMARHFLICTYIQWGVKAAIMAVIGSLLAYFVYHKEEGFKILKKKIGDLIR